MEKRFIETFKDKDEIEIIIADLPTVKGATICGGYEVWLFKTNDIIQRIKENMGEVILYTDIDIQFFKPIKNHIEKALIDNDIVFQRNPTPAEGLLNIGFMAIRCSSKTLKFWNKVLEHLKKDKLHDQQIVQDLLGAKNHPWGIKNRILKKLGIYKPRMAGKAPLRFDVLPLSFWASHRNGEQWNDQMPKDLVLHHATWARTDEEKIKQMDEVKKIVDCS